MNLNPQAARGLLDRFLVYMSLSSLAFGVCFCLSWASAGEFKFFVLWSLATFLVDDRLAIRRVLRRNKKIGNDR